MAPSRGIFITRRLVSLPQTVCSGYQCRSFATSLPVHSGHSRWSKIKHDKGKADAAINRQRSVFAHEIATASKLYGPDPNGNPRLADLITKAKKAGFAKASIEAAIARGQGRSMSGASLESVTVEGIMPNNVAVIVECETDNKLRTLAEVRLAIKGNGGTSTPTSYLFTKKGRVVLEAKDGISVEEALEPALEAGATDLEEDEDGRIVLFTEPADTRAVGEAVSKSLGLTIATSDIFWDPNEETRVEVASGATVEELVKFLDDLREKESSVQSVAMNISQGTVPEDAWEELQGRINA